MDHDRRKADGAPGQVDNIPMPAGRRVLLSTWPAAALLIIGLPVFVGWRYAVLGDHRLVTLLPTFAYYMLVILAFGRTRAPLPEPADQCPRERVQWTLTEAPRTATVPEDDDMRVAIGVAAVSRIRSAALMSIFALTAATTGLVHSVSFLTLVGAVLGVIAIGSFVRACRSSTCLNLLHAEDHTS
ncbi:hypothetical protein [Kocuria sabuli]|uniref:hypothetical protein n=1 Tax=Kocuria sabuli TaxID=3071448 RepID=UPI0034D554DD